jgi:hypothetical protein
LLINVLTLYQAGQFPPPAEVIFTVIPVIVAPAGIPENVWVAKKLVLSFPEAVTVPELADPVIPIGVEEAFITRFCPEHKLKSGPAFTVVA